MLSLLPNSSPAETAAAYTLLDVISDPIAAKQRLDDLVAEKQRSIEAMDNAKAAELAAEEKLKAAQDMADQAEAASSALDVRAKRLNDQDRSLSERTARLAVFEESLNVREAEIEGSLKPREDAVAGREAAVAIREAEAKTRLEAAEAIRSEYQAKYDKMQAALAS